MIELWRPVVGFEGLYEVSDLGRVRVLPHTAKDGRKFRGKVLSIRVSPQDGYCRVNLRKDGKQYNKTVHRIVATAFLHDPANRPEINHIDGHKWNNRASNLEWCTASENQQHALRHGLRNKERRRP